MMKILIAPSYGSGWSTWEYNREKSRWMLTYQPFIDFLQNNPSSYLTEDHPLVADFLAEADKRWPGEAPYIGSNLSDLTVESVEGPFYIHEYDGSETVYKQGNINWIEG